MGEEIGQPAQSHVYFNRTNSDMPLYTTSEQFQKLRLWHYPIDDFFLLLINGSDQGLVFGDVQCFSELGWDGDS
jgi:hypothetical protein